MVGGEVDAGDPLRWRHSSTRRTRFALCLLLSAGWLLVAVGDQGWPRTEGDAMQEDIRELIRVNEEINTEENKANMEALGKLVASELAFRRRDRNIVNRKTFLESPNPGDRKIQIESVHVYGKRAVVTCRVQVSGTVTHNIRLFVKGDDGKWRVLGWANE